MGQRRAGGPRRVRTKYGYRYQSATGRFISRAEYNAARSLAQQARAEKQAKPKPAKQKPRGFDALPWKNRAGKRVKKARTSLGRELPTRFGTSKATQLIDEAESYLAKNRIPPPHATSVTPSGLHASYWRFEGLESEDTVAVILARLRFRFEERGKFIRTQAAVLAGLGENSARVGSRVDYPHQTQRWFAKWQSLPSGQRVLEDAEDDSRLWFELLSLTKTPLSPTRGTQGNESKRRAKKGRAKPKRSTPTRRKPAQRSKRQAQRRTGNTRKPTGKKATDSRVGSRVRKTKRKLR